MKRMVIVKHPSANKKYLFGAPEGVELKTADMVICDTSRGEMEGVCISDAVPYDEESESVKNFLKAMTGCEFPLKNIIGKYEIVRFDKENENE